MFISFQVAEFCFVLFVLFLILVLVNYDNNNSCHGALKMP